MKSNQTLGHMLALFTIFVWGTTFISTKVLLTDFQPVEILLFRFVIGLVALSLFFPRRLKGTTWKQELTFAAAGLCGVCLYFLLENIALTYTLASNVGVIIAVAPFFTAILTVFFMKGEKLGVNFILGFIIAMTGIYLINFNGAQLQLNPLGDLLALLAAIVWAFYSVLIKVISGFGYPSIISTRRVFFYGILCIIPALYFFDFKLELTRFTNPIYLYNIIFLGLIASALGFVTWSFSVKVLGAVKTSVYLYMVPVVTVITSIIILHEPITLLAVIGTTLTLAGLILSENKFLFKKECKNELISSNESAKANSHAAKAVQPVTISAAISGSVSK